MTRWLPWLIGLLILAGVLAAFIAPEILDGAKVVLYRMESVADGDTINLTDGKVVRLQGINAPEMPYFGKSEQPCARESKAYLERMLSGQDLRIEFFGKDRYDRDLGFVWVDSPRMDANLANLELVRAGYAEVMSAYPPKAYRDQFEVAQSEAIRMGRGMWGQCR